MSKDRMSPPNDGKGLSKSDEADRDYEVGYGKPPKSGQFKPGRSGNVRGRKRKQKGEIDIGDILDQPVEVTSGGKRKTMEPRKIALLAQIRKAQAGNIQALAHVLDKLVKHGVLGTHKDKQRGGVFTLPNTMPFAMAEIIARRFGKHPWTKVQIDKGREEYVATRSEAQAREDKAIGYPDL